MSRMSITLGVESFAAVNTCLINIFALSPLAAAAWITSGDKSNNAAPHSAAHRRARNYFPL